MTEDSQNRVRSYGPFPEGAEPTEQILAQNAAAPPGHEAASLPPEPQPQQPNPHFPYADADAGPEPQSTPPDQQSLPPTGIYGSQAGPWVSETEPQSAQQHSGAPSAQPYSGPAGDGLPHSGSPTPTSGGPPYSASSNPTSGGYGLFRDDPDNSYGFSAPPGRRIEPSPLPQRSRLRLGLVAGLVAGLLVFGTAGWFTGRATAPAATKTTPAATSAVFEQNQIRINSPDFQGTGLTTLAKGWLPYVATCNRSGTPGGPALNQGEKTRVRCTLDGMSGLFVEYTSVAERDKARVKTLSQAADARELTPGVAKPVQRPTPSNRTTGNYVEYAYRLTERGVTRTVSGIWWDDAKTPVAGYLLAYWKDGVGENWGPMRDLWSRYA